MPTKTEGQLPACSILCQSKFLNHFQRLIHPDCVNGYYHISYNEDRYHHLTSPGIGAVGTLSVAVQIVSKRNHSFFQHGWNL